MTVDLTGQTLAAVSLDFTVTLTTEEGWDVAIEDETLARDDTLAAALTRAVGQPITAFSIDHGTLSLDVGDAHLRAAPDPTFEAWNVAGPDKQLVVCMPGGELAIWS